MSASDYTPEGQRLDVLDPEFLQSIGAIRQDWLSTVEELQRLFNDVSNTGRESVIATIGVGVAAVEPSLTLPLNAFPTPHERSLVPHNPLPTTTTNPTEVIGNFVGALTDIGTGFGEAGLTFVRQVSMAPALALVLTQQVVTQLITGQIGPDEALRRLIVEPLTALLTGHPRLTGIEQIDRAFHESALKPLIRALIRNLPKPIGQPGGLIDNVDRTVDDVVVDIRDGKVPTPKPGPLASSPELTGTDQESQQPDPETAPAEDVDDPAESVRPGIHKLPKPGDLARDLGVRVQQGIDNFQSTIKRFTTGGRKHTPAATDGPAGDAATGGDKDSGVGAPSDKPETDTQTPDRDDRPADSGNDSQE